MNVEGEGQGSRGAQGSTMPGQQPESASYAGAGTTPPSPGLPGTGSPTRGFSQE